MKKCIFLGIILILPFVLFAQDVIIRSNGERVDCKITKEDSVNVYFNIYKSGNVINTFLSREDISSFQYGRNQSKITDPDYISYGDDRKSCITIGFLQGGGSLLGADLEFLLSDQFGIQFGGGIIGFGGGINIHTKPGVQSSFFSISYWHQGIGESFAQSIFGPTYVFRGKKWFTAQIGLGVPLDIGPALESINYEQPPVMLLYSIGAYIPF